MGGGFADGRSLRKRRREEDESSSDDEGGTYVEVGEDSGDDEESTSSGEGSFRISDEGSAAEVDEFDTDFDESESDGGHSRPVERTYSIRGSTRIILDVSSLDDDAQGRGEKGGRGRRFLEEEWTNGL